MSLTKFGFAAAWLVLGLVLPGQHPAAAQEPPGAEALVKSMTDTIGGASSITLHVEKMFDDVLVTGEKLQYSGAVDIALRRPDRFYVSYGDDLSAKEVWYDGAKLTIHDHRAGVYGVIPGADTIDATLRDVAERYDLRMPLGSLLSGNAYENFVENVVEARYIGLHDVEGESAHHLYFTDGATQWQLWLDAGEMPLPLKLVVSYMDEPGVPQAIFLFTEWNLAAEIPDDLFTATIPEGAVMAAFLPRKGE